MTKLLNKIDQQTGFVAKDCLYIKESFLKKQYFNREIGNLSSITLSTLDYLIRFVDTMADHQKRW